VPTHLAPDRPGELRRPLTWHPTTPARSFHPLPSPFSRSHQDAIPCLPTAGARAHTPFLFDSGRRRVRGDSRAGHARGRLSARHGGGGAGAGLFSTGSAAATTRWRWRAPHCRPTTPAVQADEPGHSPSDAGEDAHLRRIGRVSEPLEWMVDAPPHLIGMHRAVVCSLQQFFV
jgi:hypothetical protein